MNTEEIIDLDKKYVMQTYGRYQLALKEGKGALVTDFEGKTYIDCFAGIAVNNVGHSHPNVVEAICKQAKKLIHCSNLYYTQEQVELAELLAKVSPHDKSFFCNSGAEANEGAIKLARKFTGCGEIIAMENSFHGRTIAMITATGQHKYKKGFEPLPEGFKHVDYGNVEAVADAITDNTAAVLVEPIQGEGGVIVPPKGYLKDLKKLCNENDVLLIFDEVQTGFGRTGEMFASQTFDVTPDITTVAKALGGGFPIGGVLANGEVGDAFEPGNHAATFGGNPLACAAAKASIETIIDENLLDKAKENGKYLKNKLEEQKNLHKIVEDVRGVGMMLGMEMSINCGEIVKNAQDQGVLINCTADTVLRFLPPLIIEKEQIDTVAAVLDGVLGKIS
ncbi:MAG: acetylornithine transaminase [Methanobacterium sp.]|uniref:acetylornithine transaminase n=1 Tax=Methanobacterium sp. TaxID=2164 RepID=UPI003D659E31|nr:acetylornithine transaminase [Methanobacterium sp.]